VLQAIGRVLRLDDDEHAYMLSIGGYRADTVQSVERSVDGVVLRLLERLCPDPAYVQNAWYDVLAYNRPFAHLVSDLDKLPPSERNTMWLTFTHPEWREAMPDWEAVTRRMVAQLRSQSEIGTLAQGCAALVARLNAASSHFVELWRQHEVLQPRTGHKVYDSPRAGLLRFDVATTWLGQTSGRRMVVHLPADAETERRLRLLSGAYAVEETQHP